MSGNLSSAIVHINLNQGNAIESIFVMFKIIKMI